MLLQAFSVDSLMREVPVYPAIATDANPSKHGDLARSAVPAGALSVLSITHSGLNIWHCFHFWDG
jgi:hypothetical protein